MQQYIMFEDENYKGVKGYLYQKRVKYKIKSQDEKYYFVMSDKIQKDKLNEVNYIINYIKEAR